MKRKNCAARTLPGRVVQTLAFRAGVSPTHFEFSPHEFLLAVAATDRVVRLWDLETFEV